MKKTSHFSVGFAMLERKWLRPLFITIVTSLLLILAAIFKISSSSSSSLSLSSSSSSYGPMSTEVNFRPMNESNMFSQSASPDMPIPPRFAYLISGTKGDAPSMKRLLLAVYHPRNHYLLHLDLEAPNRDRIALAKFAKQYPAFKQVGNVHVVGKASLVTYKGPSMIACTLHGAAILLKYSKHWDWFINLSATDYPLVTQDDLLHVFSYLPKDLNFIEHTSDLGWREFQRAKPMIIDPGLYMSKKMDVFWVTQRRPLPKSFKLFIGSAWMVLTRSFMEFCVFGWDNLPRTLLMYYANFVSSPEGYFHTTICNSREHRNTTVNHDLHYILWDSPPKQHPITLSIEHFNNMTASGAAFARKFKSDDLVLDKIDKELLGRRRDQVTPGGWCMGSHRWSNPCTQYGDPNILKPGPGAKRLEGLVLRQLSTEIFRASQCVIYEE